ncbi:M24 family metallopeptidase, partial [Candidatus Woesearchaeota archaeon]|nr:M24 family metallopeptidase [Candidatus Woesearchaeota archaeon]
MENLNDWIKAGKIAAEVLDYAKSLVKENSNLLDVCNEIEKKIIGLGGEPAFPVNISINYIAAHYTSSADDKSVFKNGDMVKIDIGVEVNGFVGDNALTVYLGNEKKYLD